MRDDRQLAELRNEIRRCSFWLKSVLIRQAARRTFDLTHFGTGNIERLVSSLVLAAFFFFLFLAVGHVAGLGRNYTLGLAGFAFGSAAIASAILVLWSNDDDLENSAELTREKLAERIEKRKRREDENEDDERRERERQRRRRGEACPYCQERVEINARKCKHCGEYLDVELRAERIRANNPKSYSSGVAAILSLFWPGIGQLYKRQVLAWLFYSCAVPIGYLFCVFPGVLLHIICIFDAASD